jgi:hypothetical protein
MFKLKQRVVFTKGKDQLFYATLFAHFNEAIKCRLQIQNGKNPPFYSTPCAQLDEANKCRLYHRKRSAIVVFLHVLSIEGALVQLHLLLLLPLC